jgi:hypothetical protein
VLCFLCWPARQFASSSQQELSHERRIEQGYLPAAPAHDRKLSPKTQTHYVRAVKHLARFLGRSPDTASGQDLRRFQLHLAQIGMSPISINATIVGARFFLETTLERPELANKMRQARVERRLPPS